MLSQPGGPPFQARRPLGGRCELEESDSTGGLVQGGRPSERGSGCCSCRSEAASLTVEVGRLLPGPNITEQELFFCLRFHLQEPQCRSPGLQFCLQFCGSGFGERAQLGSAWVTGLPDDRPSRACFPLVTGVALGSLSLIFSVSFLTLAWAATGTFLDVRGRAPLFFPSGS